MDKPDRKVQKPTPSSHQHILRSRLGNSETPHRFVSYLRRLGEHDLIHLKHSLGQEAHLAAPYIEPFAAAESDGWNRKMLYLVGGLFGLAGSSHEPSLLRRISFGESVARLQMFQGQKLWLAPRLIQLLEGDEAQLGHHLSYLVPLLAHYQIPIDWEALLEDLYLWQRQDRLAQQIWARSFHGYLMENAG
jgi:CRISPR type I-E-associated protein CasB/Cse2